MLIVVPEAFFQSNPPVTSSAPFGAFVRPPTPHAASSGTLAAAAPPRPNAINMFRRDICRPENRSALMSFSFRSGRTSGRDQRHLHRFFSAGDQVEALLKIGQRQLVAADPVYRQHPGLEHPDGRRPAVRAKVGAEHVEFLVVADDAPVDGDVAAEDAVLDVAAELA